MVWAHLDLHRRLMAEDLQPAPPPLPHDPPDGDTLTGSRGSASASPADETRVPNPAIPLPDRLGPYHVESLLGAGGMGRVYAALDPRLHRRVAVKLVRDPEGAHPESRARFWREARALASLRHPGIVTLYDLGETREGELYLAMELVEGQPLSRLIGEAGGARWPAAFAVEVGRQLGLALGYAHAAGLVHRDIKPSNLLVERDGQVRVVDFGLARRTQSPGESVTQAGAVLGTPAWMAPEQLEGEATSPATDVFAVGVLLYRLLTGVHPFARDSQKASALAIAGGLFTPLAELGRDLPPTLVEVVDRCLALRPEDRYPDGQALGDALAEVARGLSPPFDREAWLGFVADPGVFLKEPLSPSQQPSLAGIPSPAPTLPLAVRRRWVMAALVALGVGVMTWAGVSWQAEGPSTGWSWSSLGAHAPLPLPPRPVVTVLGFTPAGASAGDVRQAEVVADALRAWLELDPDHVVASSGSMLIQSGLGLDGITPPADFDVTRLGAASRGAGHVDLAIRGALTGDTDSTLAVAELVETERGRVLATVSLSGERDPVALALALAREIMPRLGGTLPAAMPRLTPQADAYQHWMAARRAALDADAGAARTHLTAALSRDPTFARAHLELVYLLRAERREEDARQEISWLLSHQDDLFPRDLALTNIWASWLEGDPRAAVRQLYAALETWPHAAELYEILLHLLFYEPEVRSFIEVERLSRRYLALAPTSEEAASKLVRALAWRGRGDEAVVALEQVGFPRDEVAFAEVWGELALYRQRYDEALAELERAQATTTENLYAQHMAIATRILAGDCQRAAADAVDRIDRIETLGVDANLDWTYSLAHQALMCRGLWDVDRSLLDRWAAHSASGREQAGLGRWRAALASGAPPAEVAAAVTALLQDTETSEDHRVSALLLFTRTSTDREALASWARRAERASVDPSVPVQLRSVYLRAHGALLARLAVLRGDTAGARALLATVVFPWSEVRGEGDLPVRADLLAFRAESLAALGLAAEARVDWQTLVDLGYARLWTTDLWVTARQHLGGEGRLDPAIGASEAPPNTDGDPR